MEQTNVAELPDLAQDYPLTADQIARYQRDGHILLRGVASPAEIAAYRPCILEAVKRYNTESRPLEERDTYGKAFLQTWQLYEKDERVRRFTLARRFGVIAADLMGVDGVRILDDQALFKEPGGGHTPWHQDQLYWPLETDNTITIWMPLVDIPETVGSMTFVSGSHKLDYRNMIEISDASEEVLQRFVQEHDLPQSTYGAMAAGDATFHAGWTMHRAPANPTGMMREVMTIIYFADGARVAEPNNRGRRGVLAAEMGGVQPGELAASRLNPLVVKRGT